MPAAVGQHAFNFALTSAKSIAARATLRVANLREAVDVALRLAADPERNAWVERALGFAIAHRGAAKGMAERVLKLMPAAATGRPDADDARQVASNGQADPAR